jgi:beta-phosphoglucomutase family hydrolase
MTDSSQKAVIWDMDGVIADTGIFHCRSWQYAFLQEGVVFSEEDFKHIFGQRNDTIIRNTLGLDIPQSKVDSVARVKEEYFRKIVGQNLVPFPGVINLLRLLKENSIASAIASSAPMENILLILSGLNIKDYFQAIVYGREVSEGKPSPQVFLLAAQKLGAESQNCIVIEDAMAGVSGAKRAGMRCIAVTNTHDRDKLMEADLVVDSLTKVGLNDLDALFNK